MRVVVLVGMIVFVRVVVLMRVVVLVGMIVFVRVVVLARGFDGFDDVSKGDEDRGIPCSVLQEVLQP